MSDDDIRIALDKVAQMIKAAEGQFARLKKEFEELSKQIRKRKESEEESDGNH